MPARFEEVQLWFGTFFSVPILLRLLLHFTLAVLRVWHSIDHITANYWRCKVGSASHLSTRE
jgi:hypothetical protein